MEEWMERRKEWMERRKEWMERRKEWMERKGEEKKSRQYWIGLRKTCNKILLNSIFYSNLKLDLHMITLMVKAWIEMHII